MVRPDSRVDQLDRRRTHLSGPFGCSRLRNAPHSKSESTRTTSLPRCTLSAQIPSKTPCVPSAVYFCVPASGRPSGGNSGGDPPGEMSVHELLVQPVDATQAL